MVGEILTERTMVTTLNWREWHEGNEKQENVLIFIGFPRNFKDNGSTFCVYRLFS